MDIRSKKHFMLIAMVSAGLLFAGCSKKAEEDSSAQKTDTTSQQTTQTEQTVTPVAPAPVTVPKPSASAVYFAFDVSDLDAAARATLSDYATWLKSDPSIKVTVEGNCDERGSREYNLALGQRRADSVRNFLVSHGVDASRIDTVSFGEERPVCRGTGEACWAQNRRGDIVTR